MPPHEAHLNSACLDCQALLELTGMDTCLPVFYISNTPTAYPLRITSQSPVLTIFLTYLSHSTNNAAYEEYSFCTAKRAPCTDCHCLNACGGEVGIKIRSAEDEVLCRGSGLRILEC